ncbi:MAG TPA: FHA domain-containing protein [Paenibacillus sp.]|nr:FHA domain-containing protein [Paenibacillus sp.]
MTIWEEAGLFATIDPDTGPEVVVRREGGLRKEATVSVLLGMLEHNTLSGTLPVRRETRDGDVVLRYSIAGMRRLGSALRAGPIREEQWDGLVAAIALALREGADYSIRETEYVLDPDWIWVQRDIREVKLIAVPVVGFGSPERAWRQWKSLYDRMVECGLPERWRDRLRPDRWTKETFNHRLWMEEATERYRGESAASAEPERPAETNGAPMLPIRENVSIAANSVIGKAIPEIEEGETMRFAAPSMTKRECVRLLAATVCCIVFVWKPALPSFLVAVLGCVPLGVTLYRRYFREEATETTQGEIHDDSEATSRRETAAAGQQEHPYREPPAPEPLGNRTVLLSEAQETALLSALTPPRPARLEVSFESEHRVETIVLTNAPLRFGRGPAGVDVLVDHIAASRVHLEFDVADGKPRACDLGSTNGTYYLDRLMTPHERYELRDGDMLRLPGAVIRVVLSTD